MTLNRPLAVDIVHSLMSRTRGGSCIGAQALHTAAHYLLIEGSIYHRPREEGSDDTVNWRIQENMLLWDIDQARAFFDFPFRYVRFHTRPTEPFSTQLIIFHASIGIYDVVAMMPWHKIFYLAHPAKMQDALHPEPPPFYYDLYTLDTRLNNLIEPLKADWDDLAPRICEISLHIPVDLVLSLLEAFLNHTTTAAHRGIILECWRRKKILEITENRNPWELVHAQPSRWPLIATKSYPKLDIPALVPKNWTDPNTTDYLHLSPSSQQQWPWGLRTWNQIRLEASIWGELINQPHQGPVTFPFIEIGRASCRERV